MISAYVIVLLVWGMVLTNLWVIHHFWLRVFEEDQAEQEVNERHQQGPNGPLMASDRERPTRARCFPETNQVDAGICAATASPCLRHGRNQEQSC